MNIARISTADGVVSYAVAEQDGYRLIEGDPFARVGRRGAGARGGGARLLAPVIPPQIAAIGLNYRRHAVESGMAIPRAPVLFIKTINTIIGPRDSIVLPATAPHEVDYEAELVIVMGRDAKNVSESDAPDYVFGYCCGNDVSARDCQLKLDKQWARGKCFDTFAPIGPWITTGIRGDELDIRLTLNGEVLQDSNTSDMVFSCSRLVSYLSHCMTLCKGSIIMTGTPPGVGFARTPQVWLREGDTVSVEIEHIGRLTNTVVKEDGV